MFRMVPSRRKRTVRWMLAIGVATVLFAGLTMHLRMWPPIKVGDSIEHVVSVLGEPDGRAVPGEPIPYDGYAYRRAAGDVPEASGWLAARYLRYRAHCAERFCGDSLPPIVDEVLFYEVWISHGALVYVEDGRVTRVLVGGT